MTSEVLSRKQLMIFDTTLRDGEQAPGNAMSVKQKMRIAQELEALGVNTIEAGFPAASDIDFLAVKELSRIIKGAKLCLFARAMIRDIEQAARAVTDPQSCQIEILGTASEIHLRHKRQMTRQQALDEITIAIEHAKKLGFNDISLAPEDATRADPGFLATICRVSCDAGATTILLPDTVGCLLPNQVPALIDLVRKEVPSHIRVAFHAHNDMGLATAVTLAAIDAGVDEVQATLCGIGERSGNCSIEEIVAALVLHDGRFLRNITIKAEKLYPTCQVLIKELNLPLARGKAIVGDNAFATAAGIHQAAIIRNPINYEFLEPARFGAERRILISRHSGRHALETKLEALGFSIDSDVIERTFLRLTQSDNSLFSDGVIHSAVVDVLSEIANATSVRIPDAGKAIEQPLVIAENGESSLAQSLADELRHLCAKAMGYPPEVFEANADLEADLGIDSLKQAELEVDILRHFGLSTTDRSTIMAPTFGGMVANVIELAQKVTVGTA